MPYLCLSMLPTGQLGSRGSGECLVLPTASWWPQHPCPWLAEVQLTQQLRAEQNKAIAFVQLLKQIWVLCHLFCTDKTQWALRKRQRIFSGSVEKTDVKIRCWELVGAWITPKQTKYNKTNTCRSKHKRENCLQVQENTTLTGFFFLYLPHCLSYMW